MRTTVLLSAIERQALNDALDDEYKSHATYRQVIADRGPIRPFINIAEAEVRPIGALLALYDKLGPARSEPTFWQCIMRYGQQCHPTLPPC